MNKYISHYLPVNDLSMIWGSYITGAGRGTIAPETNYPPTGHPFLYQFNWNKGRTLPEFQVILITEGRGIFESRETGEIPVESDSVVILFPNVWHRYRPDPKTGWTERWISLNGEIIHRLMNLRFIAPEEPVWKIRQPDKLTKDFDELMDDIHGQPAHNSILWSLRAMSLLTEAIELKEGKSTFSDAAKATELPLPNDPIVAQVLEMIWTCSHRDLSVDQLASQLPVTRRTLDRRFQEVLGRTVLDEITNCRLSRAKRLLAETMLPIKTVAQLAGFSNTERMRMVFLKMEKMTPIDYRFFKQ